VLLRGGRILSQLIAISFHFAFIALYRFNRRGFVYFAVERFG